MPEITDSVLARELSKSPTDKKTEVDEQWRVEADAQLAAPMAAAAKLLGYLTWVL